MTRPGRRRLVAAALAAGAALPATAGGAVDAVTMLGAGAEQNAILHVDVRAPSAPVAPIPVTGLGAGELLRGIDYAFTAGVMSFGPGETAKAFQVPTVEEAAVEGNETVEIELSDAVAADLAAAPQVATLTIVDDDTAPPGPPGGQGDDTPPTAPTGLVSLGDQRIDRSLAATVACDQACAATVALRLGRRTLASRRVQLPAAGRRRVNLALSRAEVALLRARARGPRSVVLRLTGTFADADGRTAAALAVRLG
jgi:hypothetical protein